MCRYILAIAFLFSLPAFGAEKTPSPTKQAIEAFKDDVVWESYLVIVNRGSKDCIVARFDFRKIAGRCVGVKRVTIEGGAFSPETIQADEAERLLNKFREFDWNAMPGQIKVDLPAGCSLVAPLRIAFLSWADGTYREYESFADKSPKLISLLGDISLKQ